MLRLPPFLGLDSLARITRRIIMQKARSHPVRYFHISRDSNCCVSCRFQVLFHSPPGVLFTFPSRYWYAIGFRLVFSLGRWSSQIPTGFHVSRGTRVPFPFQTPRISPTGLSPAMAGFFKPFSYPRARNESPARDSGTAPQPPGSNVCRLDTTGVLAVACSLAATEAISY